MYEGFNVNFTNNKDYFDSYEKVGKEIFEKNKTDVIQSLDEFITVDGNYDADKIMDNNFPKIKANIFLSHSHKDKNFAIKLAGWLKTKFNLDVFIDSCVWNYSDDLLKKIDEKYCQDKETKIFDYNKRNITTSHVHIMLLMSLIKMIDKTECIFFLNTPNSTNISTALVEKTYSPWIYSEILITKLIKNRKPERILNKKFSVEKSIYDSVPNFTYSLEMSHLRNFDVKTAKEWEQKWMNTLIFHSDDSLDYLYSITE